MNEKFYTCDPALCDCQPKKVRLVKAQVKQIPEEPTKKFKLLGLIASTDFQRCRFILSKLAKYYPKKYNVDIRPMLDVEWNQRILKLRRQYGSGSPLWEIKNNVAIFCDGNFFGDYRVLQEFIQKKYRFVFQEDWYCVASKHLMDFLTDKTERYRQLVYLTIAIEDKVVGSLLFELFNDIVPLTCENFFKKCTAEEGDSYVGTPFHRSVGGGWIQFGGFDLQETPMPDENFGISHDRRGILSMCNSSKHTDNTTQCFIALDAAPWMDYKYVAFGVVIQGDDVLKKIENVPTYYQEPRCRVEIVQSGEFSTTWRPHSEKLYTAKDIDMREDLKDPSIGTFPPEELRKDVPQKAEEPGTDESSVTESSSSTDSLPDEIDTLEEGDMLSLTLTDQPTSGQSVISLPEYLAQLRIDGEGIFTPQGYIPGGYGYQPDTYQQQYYEVIGE